MSNRNKTTDNKKRTSDGKKAITSLKNAIPENEASSCAKQGQTLRRI
jgi:hypothetical protein